MAGAVGRVARAHDRRLAVVARVAAEPALVDLALGRPVEREAPVLELDRSRRRPRSVMSSRRRLVDEVVAALDRVERVPLGRVLLDVRRAPRTCRPAPPRCASASGRAWRSRRSGRGRTPRSRRAAPRRRRRRSPRRTCGWSSCSARVSRPLDGSNVKTIDGAEDEQREPDHVEDHVHREADARPADVVVRDHAEAVDAVEQRERPAASSPTSARTGWPIAWPTNPKSTRSTPSSDHVHDQDVADGEEQQQQIPRSA